MSSLEIFIIGVDYILEYLFLLILSILNLDGLFISVLFGSKQLESLSPAKTTIKCDLITLFLVLLLVLLLLGETVIVKAGADKVEPQIQEAMSRHH